MKITKEQFKGIVREVMIDESEYQEFFKRALEKAGKSIPDMSDEEKKAFFNKIDAAWDAKGEKNEELTGNQHKLDVDGDGEIEASDLAALRAGKTNEAMASGPWVGLEKTPKGPKLVKTFKSGNEAKAWVMKSPGGHSIMTKKQWNLEESITEGKLGDDCGCNENHDCGCGGVHEHKHIHEDLSADANGIAGLTASRASAVKGFLEKNNIDSNKLYLFLKKGNLKDRMDFVTALVGKPGNPIQKKVISQFSK